MTAITEAYPDALYYPPLYVKLPELERDGKRIIRQVGIHPHRDGTFDAEYMERSGRSSFRTTVRTAPLHSFDTCLSWADACGR